MDRAQQWKWSRSDNPRDNHHHRGFEGSPGAVLGFSWPPRSYCCNFCGREFRSAQALGGHMNVHRRDRALLGNPNPNPNSNPNSLSSPKLSLKYAFPSFLSSPQAFLSPSTCEEGLPPSSSSSSSSPKLVDNSRIGEEELIRKKRDCASLPLLFHGSSMNRSQREHGDVGGVLLTRFGVEMPGDSSVEELDLELRLGCKSN